MWAALRRALRRLVNVFRWSAVDRDLRDEIDAHLAMAKADHHRQGLSPGEARRVALHEFGGERWLEASRSTRGIAWLHDLARDTRHALQTFSRNRGFAFAVIVVMALGVGATTAVYSVIRAVLLRPLPYADPESLHTLYEGDAAGSLRLLSYPTFREVAESAGTHADFAYARGENLIVRDTDGTLNFLAAFVTPNFFGLMGRSALAGRTFGTSDDASPVVVLSSRIASLVFGDARSALGRPLSTANGVLTVIGVMPPGFARHGRTSGCRLRRCRARARSPWLSAICTSTAMPSCACIEARRSISSRHCSAYRSSMHRLRTPNRADTTTVRHSNRSGNV